MKTSFFSSHSFHNECQKKYKHNQKDTLILDVFSW